MGSTQGVSLAESVVAVDVICLMGGVEVFERSDTKGLRDLRGE